MRTMDPGYPKPITIWKGIPESPQGAFVHKDNGTYVLFLSVLIASNIEDFFDTHAIF